MKNFLWILFSPLIKMMWLVFLTWIFSAHVTLYFYSTTSQRENLVVLLFESQVIFHALSYLICSKVEVRTVGWTKQASWRCHLVLWYFYSVVWLLLNDLTTYSTATHLFRWGSKPLFEMRSLCVIVVAPYWRRRSFNKRRDFGWRWGDKSLCPGTLEGLMKLRLK